MQTLMMVSAGQFQPVCSLKNADEWSGQSKMSSATGGMLSRAQSLVHSSSDLRRSVKKEKKRTHDMTMMTLSINRKAWDQKALVSVCLISMLIMQVQASAIYDRNKSADPCPILKFPSKTNGCRRCSLCLSDSVSTRRACKGKHPDPFPHLSKPYLWCDNPQGPFPECPHLPESVVRSKSDGCDDHHFALKFAPGCVCTVGCPGETSFSVECTLGLQWNRTNIPSGCSQTTSVALTTPQPTTTATTKRPESLSEATTTIVALSGSAVAVFLVALIAIILVTCWCKRRRRNETGSSPVDSSSSSETSSATGDGTAVPLLSGKKSQPPSSQDSRIGAKPGGTVPNGGALAPDHTEVVVTEAENPVCENPPAQNIALTRREAPPVYPQLHLDLSAASRKSAPTVQAPEVQKQDMTEDQDHSFRALQSLVNSYKHVCELTKMFDQKHAFDKVTWHHIAVDWLGWDKDDVNSTEYLLRPCQGAGNPGGGPMYKVLKDAVANGKGLLELIRCLEQCRFRYREAEEFLRQYWQDWKLKHTVGDQSIC